MSITVRNLQRSVPVKKGSLQRFAERALRKCLGLPPRSGARLAKLEEVFVLLVSDSRMADLHQRFLNQPGPTDVITFDHGEIFISVPTARRQARQFQNSLTRELETYIVHGLLHLQGYDDRDARGAREMGRLQERIVRVADSASLVARPSGR